MRAASKKQILRLRFTAFRFAQDGKLKKALLRMTDFLVEIFSFPTLSQKHERMGHPLHAARSEPQVLRLRASGASLRMTNFKKLCSG
jgi:hypothetical protein